MFFAAEEAPAHNSADEGSNAVIEQLIREITATISRLAPGQFGAQTQQNLRGALTSLLERADLVTREELDVQEAVLARARERIRALEARVAALEQQLQKKN